MMGNVLLMPPTGVVAMPMRNYGIVYRAPGVKIYIGLCAIDTFVVESKQPLFLYTYKVTTVLFIYGGAFREV